MVTLESLIAKATEKALETYTVTREDGSDFQSVRNYGSADNGTVAVSVIPVVARTVSRREHFRRTFYVCAGNLVAPEWKRVSHAVAKAANGE